MSSTTHHLSKWFSAIAILAMVFTNLQPHSVSAQGGDGIKRQVNAESGRVSFIGPASGRSLSATKALSTSLLPQNPAMALAKRFAPEFGVKNPERDLSEMKSKRSEDGRLMVRYQQKYQGIPVMGGELIVNTNDKGDLYSMNGEVSPDLSLSPRPAIDSAQARETALKSMAKWYQKNPQDFETTEPELWIYDESLLRSSTRPVELVWRMEITAKDNVMPLRELMLVNAQTGGISLHFNQVDTAWEIITQDKNTNTATVNSTTAKSAPGALSALVSTYTANNAPTLPGVFLCNQTDPSCAVGDSHARAAHQYAIGTYNLYAAQHNRNSIDNAGMVILSTVHYEMGYHNAFWSGTQMVYGDAEGWPLADDVVAHELTHGVTQHESNLFYYYQSGAINESFSDIWGEYYDQINGLGDDTDGWRWYIGEDVTNLNSHRNMADPTYSANPDKMSSYYYYKFEDDNGGVHANSGINNKAAYLMVAGGNFNGRTISALGWNKTIAIYYEAQANLIISGSDYSDLYYALQQACSNLIGQIGIAAGDCTEVKDAIDAVEMYGQPVSISNLESPLCTSDTPSLIYADDLEMGTGNWSFVNGDYPRWQLDSSYGQYAQSGSHSLYANDYPAQVTDAKAQWLSFVVPNNAYLHFAQAYGFETASANGELTYYKYDGGVLEYTANGGDTWLDAGSLIDFNGYKGTIFTGANNPLSGRAAFVGDSYGYISTRLNLISLAGQTVSFRWRMGLDEAGFDWGWWIDNIKVYTCTTFADVPNTHWAWGHIDRLYAGGITGGCGFNPLQYCPETIVTRSQMAVFLERGIHGSSYTPPPVGAGTGFSDVPNDYWAAVWIKQLAADGITDGCGPGTYCPEYPVTRDQMAVFLLRSKYGSSYTPPAIGPAGTGFADVPADHWAAPWIKQLAAEGITSGCGGGNYCPTTPVTRAQMAVFLVKNFNLP